MEKTSNTVENLITTAEIISAIAMMQECASLSNRFAKQVLTRLEADGILVSSNPHSANIRKHILDGFGDLKREILEALREINTD